MEETKIDVTDLNIAMHYSLCGDPIVPIVEKLLKNGAIKVELVTSWTLGSREPYDGSELNVRAKDEWGGNVVVALFNHRFRYVSKPDEISIIAPNTYRFWWD